MKNVMRQWPIVPLTLLLTALATPNARAQVQLKGGISHGELATTAPTVAPGKLNGRTGFALGLAYQDHARNSHLGFGTELLFSQRGGTSTTTGDNRRIDYVDVPVYLTVSSTSTSRSFAPYAYLGPQASFEVQCKTGVGDCPQDGRQSKVFEGVVGVGLRFPGKRDLSIEARYVRGFTDLGIGTAGSQGAYDQSGLMLMAGVGIR